MCIDPIRSRTGCFIRLQGVVKETTNHCGDPVLFLSLRKILFSIRMLRNGLIHTVHSGVEENMFLLETVGQGYRELADRHSLFQIGKHSIPLPAPSPEPGCRPLRLTEGYE
ncbi:MAG: hypothetical protein ACI30I_11445 [Parabacteroides sp.]